MKNIETIISSGIIEEYCLGTLPEDEALELTELAKHHPAIASEIELTMQTLEVFHQTEKPSPEIKFEIFQTLGWLENEKNIQMDNPPVINRHSDASTWRKALKGFEPESEDEIAKIRVLKDTEEHQLTIVWLKTEIVEDEHHRDEFQESILVLEGECECDFGGKIHRFRAGEFFDVPFDTPHTVRNICSPGMVVGLMQRRKVA